MRAWCGYVHAHGKDLHVRVATNRAGILLAIMRPGQLKKTYFVSRMDMKELVCKNLIVLVINAFQWGKNVINHLVVKTKKKLDNDMITKGVDNELVT